MTILLRLKTLSIFCLIFVRSCRIPPPCGTIVKRLLLTDKPGTLHAILQEFECEEPYQSVYIGSGEIEVEMDMQRIRIDQSEFKAQSLNNTEQGLKAMDTVEQNYEIIYNQSSSEIWVFRDLYGWVIYDLPNFTHVDTDDTTVSFYSKNLNLFYFIYSVSDSYDQNIAVCKSNGKCDISKYKGPVLTRDSKKAVVYDDVGIVGLEVPCCVCVDKIYFTFDEYGITKSSVLNGAVKADVVDYRVGVAYGVDNFDDKLKVQSQTLSMKKSMLLKDSKLQQALDVGI